MGGKAFKDKNIPRMSPKLYHRLTAEYKSKLGVHFEKVTVPRDAPGKTDYGDIDFLVDGKRHTSVHDAAEQDFWKFVEHELGAELHQSSSQTHHFGIPSPQELVLEDESVAASSVWPSKDLSVSDVSRAYVQVDIELSPGSGTPDAAALFEWTRFMKGDGDLLQIVGIAHRPLGLTCTDTGLHVRLEQIEPYDKKEARLFLTRNPDQAMQFYGLDVEKHTQGFNSETELFDWVAAGRFFSQEVFERRIEKADDRTRSNKRPMYRRFITEYMPRIAHGSRKDWSREDVLREALEAFDVQSQYDKMIAKHNLEEAEKALWEEIKATIPAKDKSLKSAVRALRRWVGFNDGTPVMLQHPNLVYFKWAEHVDQSNKSNVLEWVESNWQRMKSQNRAQQTSRAQDTSLVSIV